MIFGRTYDEIDAEEDLRYSSYVARVSRWHPYFAYLPLRLEDGRIAWWQMIERRGVFICRDGEGECPSYYREFAGWVYREL